MRKETSTLTFEPLQKHKIQDQRFMQYSSLREVSSDYVKRWWKLFTSVKLSVVLLLTIAATSMIGTVIPQNKSPQEYLQAFSEPLYRIFDTFDLFDMYHSWWFQLLILTLSLNLLICSIDRLSATWKIVSVKNPPFNLSKFRRQSNKIEFAVTRFPHQLEEIYMSFVAKRFKYTKIEHNQKGFLIFAEKQRWTRFGVYMVHLSVLFLLIGALIGSIFGFDGYVNIPEGEAVSSIRLKDGRSNQKLDFKVRCEDFHVSFYDTGMPKEYRSSLSIIEGDTPVFQKNIIVNDPLRYKGINFFQSSYGPLPPRELTLSISSMATGKAYSQNVIVGKKNDLPEDLGEFVIKGFRESATFKGQNIGEAFLGTLTPKGKNPVFMLLPVRYPNFDRMRRGNLFVSVTGYKQRYYTGLQVTSDPGVLMVYTGFILMIIGCYVTFFMSHQRLCIDVQKEGQKSKVMIAGTANKNKLGMQTRVKKISKLLNNL